jgi:methyltransferase
MIGLFPAVMTFLLVQRAAELVLAERNRRWVLSRGGREFGSWHYPLIVGMHILFYISLLLEWIGSPALSTLWPLWLALLVVAQLARIWVVTSLGRFWNTRIIVLPGFAPVRTGPYRYVRHPNYLVVVVEILIVPLMFRAWVTAAVFTLLNLILLGLRIPEEEAALSWATEGRMNLRPRFTPRPSRIGRAGRAAGIDDGSRSE